MTSGDPPGKRDEAEEHLELVPAEEPPAAEPAAAAEPEAEGPAEPPAGDGAAPSPERSEDVPPPLRRTPPVTLLPLELGRILAWPLQGGMGLAFLGGFFLLLLVLLLAWGAGLIWIPLRILLAGAGGAWFLAYPGRALLATADREPGPPPWPPLSRSSPAWREGARLLVLLLACGAPAIAVWLATGSLGWSLGVTLAVWLLTPAAVLAFSLGGRFRDARPLLALRIALAGGRRYLLCAAPVPPWLTARFLVDSRSVLGPILEAGAWIALVLTAHMLGLLVGESAGVSGRVSGLRRG